jgi:hypothetical protein
MSIPKSPRRRRGPLKNVGLMLTTQANGTRRRLLASPVDKVLGTEFGKETALDAPQK